MNLIVYSTLNLAFAVIVSPFFMGTVKKTKAYCQGRKGVPAFQPYYDLAKLMKKERIYSTQSSWITRINPYLSMASILTAALCIPLLFIPESSQGLGNAILFIYLLALGRFFMAIAGLDSGSAFGGMGSSREMTISSIIEPITILSIAGLAFTLHTADFYVMFSKTLVKSALSNPGLLLISISLFIVAITETSRLPVDNPETHLELTMTHEAMILEYSGRDLALMELSHAIKQTLLMAILINILVPVGLTKTLSFPTAIISGIAFIFKGYILSIFIGFYESSSAKLRFFSLPNLFMTAFFFTVLTILLEVF